MSRGIKGSFRKVSHAIFDMDGLLLDTERLYTEATQNIVGEFGKVYDWDTKNVIMGLTGAEAAKRLVEIYELPISWEEYYTRAQEQYQIVMLGAKLMPDTEGAYYRVLANIVARYGKTYTPEMRAKVLGTQAADTSKIIVRDSGIQIDWKEFLNQFRPELLACVKNCPLLPGAERLIRHLRKHNVPCAVATSSAQESYLLKTKNHQDFFNLFQHIVTGGSDPEVKHGKPAPDIFQICASRFPDKPKYEDCLVFEDAPNGVTGALAAGMQCVMIPDEHTKPELCKHATIVYKSLNEFEPELFGLPEFPNK